MSIDRFILASASPRRSELLNQIGIVPEIMPSDIVETITSSVPSEVVKSLSRQKATDISSRLDCDPGIRIVVLGADTVVSIDGQILGKPQTHSEAGDMIRKLQGRDHQVYTGVTILVREGPQTVKSETFAIKTDVHVYPMSEQEILNYASSDEPMDKAGAYGIQGYFARYIRGIDGDYNNVVGLPVSEVYQRLKYLI